MLECIISYVLLVEYSRLDKGKRDTRQYTRVELHDTVCVLLFENGRVPVDGSKDCYKIEIHFSPGAKGGEEIITAGESFSCLGLDSKKNVFLLKRQLPDEDRLSRKSSTSSLQFGTTVRIKQQKSRCRC